MHNVRIYLSKDTADMLRSVDNSFFCLTRLMAHIHAQAGPVEADPLVRSMVDSALQNESYEVLARFCL